MKYAAWLLVCCFVLVSLLSCKPTTEGEDPTPEDTDYSLYGLVKDSDGNIITDANIYIDFGVYRFAVGDTTLPVELSSFSAVLTPQNFVKLTWVTQYETNLYGFKLYRSESTNLNSSYLLTPTAINPTNTSQATTYNYIDNEVANHTTYYYWLEVVEMDGTSSFHGPTFVYVEGEEVPELPLISEMWDVYCNPFGSYNTCTIPCAVPDSIDAKLYIKSILSGVIKTFLLTPGMHNISWNGRDSNGVQVCGGIYQVQMISKTQEGVTVYDKTLNILLYDIERAYEPVVRSSTTGYKISYQKYFQFGTVIHHTGANQENYGDYLIPQQFKLIVKKSGYQTVEKQINITNLNVSRQEDIVLQTNPVRK